MTSDDLDHDASGGDTGAADPAGARTDPGSAPDSPSRRRFLIALGAVGITAAAGGVLWEALGGSDDDDDDGSRSTADPRLNATSGTTTKALHFNLTGANVPDTAVIVISGMAIPLLRHGADTTTTTAAATTAPTTATSVATTTTAAATTTAVGATTTSIAGGSAATTTAVPSTSAATTTTATAATSTTAGTTTTTGKTSKELLDELPPNIDRSLLTHYVDGAVVSNVVITKGVIVSQADDAGFIPPGARYLGSFVHVPTSARLALAEEHAKRDKAVQAMTSDPAVRKAVADAAVGIGTVDEVRDALAASAGGGAKPALLGSAAAWKLVGSVPATPTDAALSGDAMATSFETAVSMVLHHPEILKLDGDAAAKVKSVLMTEDIGELQALADQIDELNAEGKGVGGFDPVVDSTGKAITYPTDPDADGQAPPPNTPLSLYQMDPALDPAVHTAANAALAVVLTHPDLKGISWFPPEAAPPNQPGVPGPATPSQLQGGPATYTFDGHVTDHRVDGLRVDKYDYDSANRALTMSVGNDWYRHVGIGIEFYDDQGNGVKLPSDYGAGWPWKTMNTTEYLGMLGMVTSAPNVLGVPILGENWTDVSVKFPADASRARVFLMGMSWNVASTSDSEYFVDDKGQPFKPISNDSLGMHDAAFANLCTFVLDLALPAVFMMTGAIRTVNRSDLDAIRKELQDGWSDLSGELEGFIKSSRIKGAAVVAGVATAGILADTDTHQGAFDMVKSLVLTVLAKPAGFIAEIVWRAARQQGGTAALKAVPFLGEVLGMFGVATNFALVMASVTELSFASNVNTFEIKPTYDATIVVTPDDGKHGTSGDKYLPRTATRYELHHIINGHTSTKVWKGPVSQTDEDGLSIKVAEVPVGSTIKWSITLFSDEGWTVGQGVSEEFDNSDWSKPPADVSFSIVEALYPVNDRSSYHRRWTTTATPDEVTADESRTTVDGTQSSLDADSATALQELDGITVATLLGVAGYVWRADGKWYARNMATGLHASSAWNEAGPFARRPHLTYDALTADPTGARNFLLEPDASRPIGYYVRPVDVKAGSSLTATPKVSVAQIPSNLDDAAYNPLGYVVGVDTTGARLFIAGLATPGPDSLAPMARPAGGPGDREGLLTAPAAVACRAKGDIIVLDIGTDGAPTLRAFGIDGKPRSTFAKEATNVSIKRGSDVRSYVGLAIDGGDYNYVLSYLHADDPASWRLDVYDPEGTWVFATDGVNAGRMAVDYWRNVFSLNYEILPNMPTGGQPYQLFGVPEPSVSAWIPKTPA